MRNATVLTSCVVLAVGEVVVLGAVLVAALAAPKVRRREPRRDAIASCLEAVRATSCEGSASTNAPPDAVFP